MSSSTSRKVPADVLSHPDIVALVEQGRPTGSRHRRRAADRHRGGRHDSQHLKAVLRYLSEEGVSVVVSAEASRSAEAVAAAASSRARPSRPSRQEGARQEGRRAKKARPPRRPRRKKTAAKKAAHGASREADGGADAGDGRRGRSRRQEDPARPPRRAVREGRQDRPHDRGGREGGRRFVVSEADDTDEPEQQVMVAGATADPVKDYLKQIGKVPLLNAEMEVELAKRIEAGLFSRGEARQGRQDLREARSRSSSGSPRTAAAPRTTCSRPTCASSSRWPSATPAAACSSST